jgi:hypothetical protein
MVSKKQSEQTHIPLEEKERVADGRRLGFLAGGVPRLTDGRAAARGSSALGDV